MLAFQRDKRPQVISCRYKCTRAWCYRNRRVTSSFPKTKTSTLLKSPRDLRCNSTHHRHTEVSETLHIQLIVCTNIGHCAEVQPLSQPSEADLKCTPQPTGEPEISSSGYTCTQLKILFSWLMNDTNMWLYSQLEVLEDWVRRVSWISLASQPSWCSWITTWQ